MREVSFKYDQMCLYIITYQSRGEGKVNTQIYYGTYRQMYLIGQTVRYLGIYATHPTGLGFIQIRIQSEF